MATIVNPQPVSGPSELDAVNSQSMTGAKNFSFLAGKVMFFAHRQPRKRLYRPLIFKSGHSKLPLQVFPPYRVIRYSTSTSISAIEIGTSFACFN
jgi:hypothetical protein